MPWYLPDLDAALRGHAFTEAKMDNEVGRLYVSKRARFGTESAYFAMLTTALQSGTPETFAEAIWNARILKPNLDGTPHAIAHEVLGHGEFVRYYIRGLCDVAIMRDLSELEVYRGKPVANPRSESLARIGLRLPVSKLLSDLRTNIGVDTALGVPGGPNSGLCVRLPA